jgi:hypothetical protein
VAAVIFSRLHGFPETHLLLSRIVAPMSRAMDRMEGRSAMHDKFTCLDMIIAFAALSIALFGPLFLNEIWRRTG